MTELRSLIDGGIALFDTASKHLLILSIMIMPGSAGEFLWQMMVSGLHQAKSHVVVQCLGAGDLFASEFATLKCPTLAGIQRPTIFADMLVNIGDESVFGQTIIVTAAVSAIILIDLLALFRLISLNMSVVQVNHAAFHLIAHHVESTTDFNSNSIR